LLGRASAGVNRPSRPANFLASSGFPKRLHLFTASAAAVFNDNHALSHVGRI
jgi:hypothetical protein